MLYCAAQDTNPILLHDDNPMRVNTGGVLYLTKVMLHTPVVPFHS